MTGCLAESRAQWEAAYPAILISEAERIAKTVECRSPGCGAAIDYPCMAVTGMVASGPHEVRTADAVAAAKDSATKAAA